jgi:Na+-driven multidrug efflux pump
VPLAVTCRNFVKFALSRTKIVCSDKIFYSEIDVLIIACVTFCNLFNCLFVIYLDIAKVASSLFALFARPVLGLFTDDPQMVALVRMLLMVDIALEIGRMSNLVYGFALKTSGDAVYPMLVAVVFAFLCAAGGTWLFGVKLGGLAVGAYAAMALDECVRAVFLYLRWRKGCWKTTSLVKARS